jgi:hypothetical protein
VGWIESTFGVSPDGGNGLTEALIALSIVLVVVVLVIWSLRRNRA